MPALRSSVLIVQHPNPELIQFGADFAASFEAAREAVGDFSYPVIALPSSHSTAHEALQFLEFLDQSCALSQRVIVQNDTSADELRRLINHGSVFRVLDSFKDLKFDHTIQEALEEYRLRQQNSKLLQLVNEQNERLKRLTGELEERVEARRKSLEDAKQRLLTTNERIEALHKALVAIHQAGSVGEMERLINEALRLVLGLSWTRILFNSQGQLHYQNGLPPRSPPTSPLPSQLVALHSAALTRGKESLGHIYFARESNAPFSRDESNFLGQIADSVSLAIDRLTKLEQSESLKRQWEDTFDAILDPVALIDHEYKVMRINRSFASRAGSEPERIIGHKCYEALFHRTAPCEGCLMMNQRPASDRDAGTPSFRLKPARTNGGQTAIFDVYSQKIPIDPDGRSLFVNVYRDISSQLLLERQLLETAKMAELGTIGSSIAHELNNPLGGMLNFLQLIRMDLKGSEPWFDDIQEMEKGAQRCRDIVRSLLGFTRKSAQDSSEDLDLREVVDQALKITELQTRAMGIKVVANLPDQPARIRGSFNFLAQAMRNFLQSSQDAISRRLKSGDRTPGIIQVSLTASQDNYQIEIKDNGYIDSRVETGPDIDAFDRTSLAEDGGGLGLTVAQQIIKEIGGRVEFSREAASLKADTKIEATAKISLPRPVFES